MDPRIGIDLGDLRCATRDGLQRAAEMRFRVVEMAASGEVAPSNLSATGRRHLSHLVGSLGIELASLTADLPRLRLDDPSAVSERVHLTEQILHLAADLKVPVVGAGVGALTDRDSGEPLPIALDALKRIGEVADATGTIYALRPTCETGEQLATVLGELRCPSIGICLDPASLVMSGVNPLASVERWIEQVALFHARDGTAGLGEQTGTETRLGEGEVDLVGVLATLDAVDYSGPHILRRRDSRTPLADLQDARDALTRLLPT